MAGLRQFGYKREVGSILLGQFLSLLITSTGFTSSELARRGINAPTSQSFLNYVLLALVYGIMVLCRRNALKAQLPYDIHLKRAVDFIKYEVLKNKSLLFQLAKWYYYLILGLVDVEANYLVVKAYQYTSLTSVMLLDCWSIPCVIFLTRIFLKTKYRLKKIAGVIICVAGLIMVVFSDVHAHDRAAGSAPIKGDLLVIAGSTLYAVSNVGEEYFVKSADRVELMSMLGIFGAIISACQIGIFERTELRSIHWKAASALPFVGFSVAMFLFYSLVPILLMASGAALLNLSLLTSDMWAVVIRICLYHEKVDWLYFVAFAAVAVGLIIYAWGDQEDQISKAHDEEANVENPRQDAFVQHSARENEEHKNRRSHS